MPHDVEQDPAENAAGLERFPETDVDRLEARPGIEADAPEDLGRHVDLGVVDPVVGERPGHGERGADVVLGPPEETAHVGEEPQESGRIPDGCPRLLEGGGIREAVARSNGEAGDLGRRQTAFEVEVAVGEGEGVFGLHNRTPDLQNRRGHPHYMRRPRLLALLLDVLLCAVAADVAGLALTGIVWRFLPALRGAIPAVWAAAGTAAVAAFLLRDARGGSGPPLARPGGETSRRGAPRPMGVDPA